VCCAVLCGAVFRGAWLRERESRLTGSALANMLSWFDGQDRADHVRLWREKLGLQKPPPGETKILTVLNSCILNTDTDNEDNN
jgi:hypothetical protein